MTTWIKNAEIGKNKEIKNAETCQNAQYIYFIRNFLIIKTF